MQNRTFHIVDVFAEQQYSGNQLAVFIDGHLYSEEEMRKLAIEMNYSEITFIFPHESTANGYRVRIFTPGEELPFAGHPTLGTAYIIAKVLAGDRPNEVVLNLNAGNIPVAIQYDAAGNIDKLTMKQLPPVFGPELNSSTIADALGVSHEEMDPAHPVQEVSTGVPFVIAPLKSLQGMRSINVDPRKVATALQGISARAILAFCPETYQPENQLNARVFVHYYGVAEDPATGSANGCLAGYLMKHRYFDSDSLNARVEQGFEIKRESVLYLSGQADGDTFRIYVGGRVQHIASATLLT